MWWSPIRPEREMCSGRLRVLWALPGPGPARPPVSPPEVRWDKEMRLPPWGLMGSLWAGQ